MGSILRGCRRAHHLCNRRGCATGEAHVFYQGLLDPKKFLRASIPMPTTPISSMVTLKATRASRSKPILSIPSPTPVAVCNIVQKG